jgi:valyl-tRNA synthetase
MDYPTRFDFKEIEPRIYDYWEKRGLFHADPSAPRSPFTIVIPPPNITGSLHMGHALNNTLQDVLIRYHKMNGRETLYLPGTDHAGIATQFVVEKNLKKEENRTRFDLGREKFLERVWKWKDQYGNAILNQLRRMGGSCDWQRTRFTLDPGYARAVLTVFVSLFKKGLVYRGLRLVNWCPSCKTALSDLEAVQKKESGKLWHLKYPVQNRADRFLTVATTRPETMLGDTAVACHPQDPRYKDLAGARVRLPLANRDIPVLFDDFVARDFGTGVVKITPAHDFVDFEVGERHKLPKIQVIDESGKMTPETGAYQGLDRFACRKKVLADLEAQGLLEKTEEYEVALGRCYRCDTILEPYLSLQWFVSMKPLAVPAIEAVKKGDILFHPERYVRTYLDWMENIKDWCISRQLWWGHRIPVYYCAGCGTALAAVDPPDRCVSCGAARLEQDPDVLDTWFSSALWPFATLGWPEETEELEKFYPTSALVTSRDIINLWVARMIVAGYEFCGDRPFSDVVIHPQIQTLEGRRMSKSLGTGIDPLDLVDEYGADALRFCLAEKCTGVQDIRFGVPHELLKKKGLQPEGRDDRSMIEARNFITKVWNGCRFVLINIASDPGPVPDGLELEDRWILSKLATTARAVSADLDGFEFGRAAQRLFHFTWDDFCDYYIELSKSRLSERRAQSVLLQCIDTILRLLHPIAPFVTEAIWQKLKEICPPWRGESLMCAEWPEPPESWVDRSLEAQFEGILSLVREIRGRRREYKVPPRQALAIAELKWKSEVDQDVASAIPKILAALANASVGGTGAAAVHIDSPLCEARIEIPGYDRSKDLASKEKELQARTGLAGSLRKRLQDPGYRSKASEDRIAEDEGSLAELEAAILLLRKQIDSLRGPQ